MELKKRELSILIPTYNKACGTLVADLQAQAEATGIDYEIIVADDGSTDQSTIEANERDISHRPHCTYIIRGENVGRAKIRNFLAQKAQFCRLLFIDSDMSVGDADFISRYAAAEAEGVVDGGVKIVGDERLLAGNLRFLYEKAAEPEHTAEKRRLRPHQHLHTANLMIARSVMTDCPFDERFSHYGYEDVMLGKELHERHIPVCHIDNPLDFGSFETNAAFVAKTEEGLRTLYSFRDDLRGYSTLLTVAEGIHLGPARRLLRLLFAAVRRPVRRHLCGRHPNVTIFKLYKLGYYLSLTN